jgi:FkbM family methyltransferase
MYKEVEGRWGKCKFLAKDEYVGKSLYYYGEYNPDETEKILSLATKGKLCLDIGANIGCISQALLANGHTVLAFEPQKELHNILTENIAGMGGVAINAAVGSEIGTARLPKVHYSDKNNFGGLGIGTPSIYGSVEVPVITIDTTTTCDIGFIKIDVEGFEYEVLLGATNTIKRYRPVMYIEDDRADKSLRLRGYIASLGYSIEEHKPTLYREHNFFGLRKNVWDRNYASHNLICIPTL